MTIIKISLFFFLLSIGCSSDRDGLKTLESYTLPIMEISGMCWRKNGDGPQKEIVLVSDDTNKLYFFDWEKRRESSNVRELDVNQLKGVKAAYDGQWEAIACADSGKMFLLQESPARIVVINRELTEVLYEINLNTESPKFPKLKWPPGAKSAGEGLVLLKNGRFLVAKEKKPSRVVVFSPVTGVPSRPVREYGVENFWKLSKIDKERLEDISELAEDSLGNLFLLSDKSQAIALISKDRMKGSDELNIKKYFSLPSDIKKPEGLLIDEAGRPIVGIDSKSLEGPNLFLLNKLETSDI